MALPAGAREEEPILARLHVPDDTPAGDAGGTVEVRKGGTDTAAQLASAPQQLPWGEGWSYKVTAAGNATVRPWRLTGEQDKWVEVPLGLRFSCPEGYYIRFGGVTAAPADGWGAAAAGTGAPEGAAVNSTRDAAVARRPSAFWVPALCALRAVDIRLPRQLAGGGLGLQKRASGRTNRVVRNGLIS